MGQLRSVSRSHELFLLSRQGKSVTMYAVIIWYTIDWTNEMQELHDKLKQNNFVTGSGLIIFKFCLFAYCRK